ncbi:MAG: terminase small subunit [Candidatus Hodarchaeales archaeon]
MSLSPKQKRFCAEYLKDLNATQATIRAGYSKNVKSARLTGHRMLTNDKVQREIQRLIKKREKRTEITQDMVLQELAILAFSDFRHYGQIKEDGSLEFYPFRKIKGQRTRAIESMNESVNKNGRTMSLKLHSKTKALEMLARHLGMFVEPGDKLAEIIYEISEKFMPKTGNAKE